MRHQDINTAQAAHIHTLRVFIAALVILNAGMAVGWMKARADLTVNIPPDLRYGASINAGEIAPANVFNFAGYIFQQLNRWRSNGDKDYAEQIYSLSAFFTPAFQARLIDDMNERHQHGELTNRVRYIQMIPGHGFEDRRVDVIDPNNWVVWLDFSIHEYVNGMSVKTVPIRYPILVTRYDIDPESNPWGLAIKGYAAPGPTKLTEEDLNASDQPTGGEHGTGE